MPPHSNVRHLDQVATGSPSRREACQNNDRTSAEVTVRGDTANGCFTLEALAAHTGKPINFAFLWEGYLFQERSRWCYFAAEVSLISSVSML